MTQDFYVDPATHDWPLEGGTTFRLCETQEELTRQKLEIRLKKIRGEWFVDGLDGVPYFQSVYGKNPKNQVDAIFKSVIRNTQNITKITRFKSEVSEAEGRLYKLTFSAKTPFGELKDVEVEV